MYTLGHSHKEKNIFTEWFYNFILLLLFTYNSYFFYQWILEIYTMHDGASLVAQTVKNLSAVQETWVQSLGQEDPLQKGMSTHSSILAWRISWTEEHGGL